jgi:predicted DsbA family dithiol-disulfide isomerase
MKLTPRALKLLREAFVGPKAYGAIAVTNIPGYGDKLNNAFGAGIDLALNDAAGRKRAAAVNNTYPGWSGVPGEETHPLQSSFLYNVKEEIDGGKVDPYFGKNIFPSKEYQHTFRKLANPMHSAALQVLKGCDEVLESCAREQGFEWSSAGRSLHRLGDQGPALAGRFICYDSGFTREDKLLDRRNEAPAAEEEAVAADVQMVAKSAGHAGDGLASMRTHSTPVKSVSHSDKPAFTRAPPSPTMSKSASGEVRAVSTESLHSSSSAFDHAPLFDPSMLSNAEAELGRANEATDVALHAPRPEAETAVEDEAGEYWLPWHIDSNFATILHKEMYAFESTAELAPEPEGAGLLVMNEVGDVGKVEVPADSMLLQMGAFAQIYAGGMMTACRHAVISPRPPGIARFNYCNFWYVPWTTMCDTPAGLEHKAVNKGWNAMMDESYVDITMKQSFAAFRQFMVSPEARMQFADTVRFKELAEFLPLSVQVASVRRPDLVVDVLTDVRCPFSALSQRNLDRALDALGVRDRVAFRYHPIFLNPNVPKEGESLDDYLLREYGYTKEYAHSENYPIRVAGLEAGISFNPHRRVVNTLDAFCLIEVASALGKQDEVVKALSRRYFEDAEDISDEEVLRNAAIDAGLDGDMALLWMKEDSLRQRVWIRYEQLSQKVGEVPHFLLRDHASGRGIEIGGNRSVAEWQDVVEKVLEKGRLMGMSVPGYKGEAIALPEANPHTAVSLAFPAQHGWTAGQWPFSPADFSRMDESPDTSMYAEPRFVEHLDMASLERLTEFYRSAFSSAPRDFSVLDLCSSWNSHFPSELMEGSRVVVHGLNAKELQANKQANEWHVQDLNADARLPWEDNSFDFVTLALSIQYLTDPRAVFTEIHRVMKPGGMAMVAFSHRSFIEKCVRLWAEATYDGEGHAHAVGQYFQHGPKDGWESLSSIDVSPPNGDPMWPTSGMCRT